MPWTGVWMNNWDKARSAVADWWRGIRTRRTMLDQKPELKSALELVVALDNLNTMLFVSTFVLLVETVLWLLRDALLGTAPIILAGMLGNLFAVPVYLFLWIRFRSKPPSARESVGLLWLHRLYAMLMTLYAIGIVLKAGWRHDVLHVYAIVIYGIAGFIYLPEWFGILFFAGSSTVLGILLHFVTPDPESLFVKLANLTIMTLFAIMVNHVVYQRKIKDFLNVQLIEEQNRRLTELLDQDPMTLLYNKEAVRRRIELEIERARRIVYPFCLMLFDLDDFKRINDLHGHPTGDRVLKQLATDLSRFVRHADVAGRYGGEEFLVLMPGTNADHAALFAERYRQHVQEMDFGDGIRITISGGIIEWKGDTAEDLIASVDQQLYQAKRGGKNRFEVA